MADDSRSIMLAEQTDRAIESSRRLCNDARRLRTTAAAFNRASAKRLTAGAARAEPPAGPDGSADPA